MADQADSITPPPAAASPIAPGTLDRHGTPFDGKKHLPKKHPTGGNWLPKGGYTAEKRAANAAKKAAQVPAAPAAAPTPAPVIPAVPAPVIPAPSVVTVSADPTEALAAAMARDMPPVSGANAPKAANPAAALPTQSKLGDDSLLPPAEPEEGTEESAAAATPAPAAKDEGDPDADAEIALEVIFDLVGLGTGHYDEARPVPARVASMRRVVSAWFKKRGWASVGGWAVLVSFLAYFSSLLRQPKTGATVKGWLGFGKKDEDARAAAAKDVTPRPVAVSEPAPAPVKSATPAAPGKKPEPAPFAGITVTGE